MDLEPIRRSIDWEQPFPPQEYDDRRRRVREALAAQDVAAIYVTNPPDLCWLTGYDMVWFHLRCLTGLLIRADSDEAVLFDYVTHKTIVATTPEVREVVWFREASDATGTSGRTVEKDAAIIADHMIERGLRGARIALQLMCFSPHATTLLQLGETLNEAGIATGDGSVTVEWLRRVKSPREQVVMRDAAQIADAGMVAAQGAIREGARETDVEAAAMTEMLGRGAGYPALRTMVGSGPRSGTRHSPPTHRTLKRDDLIYVDFCASLHRYHVNLVRTFSVGSCDPRIAEMMDKADRSIDILIQAAQPGMPLSELQSVGEAYATEAGLMDKAWFVGGYLMGLSLPPDWVGNLWVGPRFGMPDVTLEPGVVFNFENQFDPPPDWGHNTGVAYIDTLMMTETGLQPLSRLPRTVQDVS
ncbi:MAG: Xaa-Pro peptidase family protein [Pseudomonadota bacterium]